MIGNCSSSGWRLSIPVILRWFCPDEYGLVVVALNHHYLSTTPPARLPDTGIFPTSKHSTASRGASSDGDVVLGIRNPQQIPGENRISVHANLLSQTPQVQSSELDLSLAVHLPRMLLAPSDTPLPTSVSRVHATSPHRRSRTHPRDSRLVPAR